MHVFRLCRSEISSHAWTYCLINRLSTSLSNSLGRTRLFSSRHASWNWRHSTEFMPIVEVRRSSHSHYTSKTLLYRRSQRNRNVPRFKSENSRYCIKYGLLSMREMWSLRSNFWKRVHKDDDGPVWHRSTFVLK